MIQAATYLNEADMRAAYIASRNRLMKPKLKPANTNKQEPETIIKVVIAAAAPEWMRKPTFFSHHVRAFYAFTTDVGSSPIRKFIAVRAIDLGFTYAQVTSKTLNRSVIRAKHIIMWEIRNVVSPGMSYTGLGRIFSNDHSVAVHACQRIQRMKDRGEVQTLEAAP